MSVLLVHASLGEDGPSPHPPRPPAPPSVSSPLDQSSATATSYLPELGLLQTRASGSQEFVGHAGPGGGLDAAQGPAMGHHFVRIPVGPSEQEASGKTGLCVHHSPCPGQAQCPRQRILWAGAEGRAKPWR